MTEQHECVWRIFLAIPNSATARIRIRCRICHEPLSRQNAEDMLNEYEALKKATGLLDKEGARLIATDIEQNSNLTRRYVIVLRSYAGVLEGEK